MTASSVLQNGNLKIKPQRTGGPPLTVSLVLSI